MSGGGTVFTLYPRSEEEKSPHPVPQADIRILRMLTCVRRGMSCVRQMRNQEFVHTHPALHFLTCGALKELQLPIPLRGMTWRQSYDKSVQVQPPNGGLLRKNQKAGGFPPAL